MRATYIPPGHPAIVQAKRSHWAAMTIMVFEATGFHPAIAYWAILDVGAHANGESDYYRRAYEDWESAMARIPYESTQRVRMTMPKEET